MIVRTWRTSAGSSRANDAASSDSAYPVAPTTPTSAPTTTAEATKRGMTLASHRTGGASAMLTKSAISNGAKNPSPYSRVPTTSSAATTWPLVMRVGISGSEAAGAAGRSSSRALAMVVTPRT